VFCMGLFLADRAGAKDQQAQTIQAEIDQNECLIAASEQELEKDRKELTQKVEAIRKFVSTRIQWTGYTSDISAALPPRATIHSLHGLCELESGAGKKST